MDKVLLSIKPEFANKIFSGEKEFEYRKVVFKRKHIKTILVYSSSPVQRVIGEFEIEHIISMHPNDLWNVTSKLSGLSHKYFQSYFESKEIGYAIKIKCYRLYPTPKFLKDVFQGSPPQSFCYL